jgi:hypothetical protein
MFKRKLTALVIIRTKRRPAGLTDGPVAWLSPQPSGVRRQPPLRALAHPFGTSRHLPSFSCVANWVSRQTYHRSRRCVANRCRLLFLCDRRRLFMAGVSLFRNDHKARIDQVPNDGKPLPPDSASSLAAIRSVALPRRISSCSQSRSAWFLDVLRGGVLSTRSAWVLCHEHRQSTRRCATVREMKEGPSGSAVRC